MDSKRIYSDRATAVELAGQKKVLSPAEFSSKGISFTVAADRPDGVSIHFMKEKTAFSPGFSESVPLLSVENLGDAKRPGIIDSVFARPAPRAKSATSESYSAGVVYKDKSELMVLVKAAPNGNGVVFDYGDLSKKAYFFGGAAGQLSDFIAGTEYAGKFKIESSDGTLSIIRSDDGRTMKLDAEPAIYAEYSQGGFLRITNTPPGYRVDPSYSDITITPDGKMVRHYIASE